MNKALMRYIPREYKNLVENIREGEPEYNEITGGTAKPLIVEWKNGEITEFQNKAWARFILKDQHTPEDFMEV